MKRETLFCHKRNQAVQSQPIVSVQLPSGAIEVSDIIAGHRVSRRYFGYTKAEAVAIFQEQTKPTTLDISPL